MDVSVCEGLEAKEKLPPPSTHADPRHIYQGECPAVCVSVRVYGRGGFIYLWGGVCDLFGNTSTSLSQNKNQNPSA